jgi:hypothetical protein
MSRGSKSGLAPLLSFSRLPSLSLLVTLSLLGAGCGGGGGSSSAMGTGAMTVTLTDSPAHDVARFTVDLTAITLTSSEGSVVNGLQHATTVDLATLTRSSQVLSIQGVDGGHYTSASVTFDFTSSSCLLVDQTTEAALLDDDGAPLIGTVTLPLDLSSTPIVVSDGGRYEVELDFDLDQSLTVDDAANSVIVTPALVVRTNRTDTHVNLAQGALTSLDAPSMSAAMDLQTPTKFSLGPARVNFSAATIFQVDGVPALGSAGVALLGAKPVGTWAQVFVAVSPVNGTASIAYVEAGSGTFNGGQALVEGVIVDRGNSLGNKLFTVHGRSSSADHSTELFNTDFQVTVKPGGAGVGARVVQDTSSSTSFTVDALNIGQRVQVFGTLTGTTMDATATTAIVRAEPTSLFAFANSAPSSGILSVDLVVPAPLARVEEIGVVTTTTPFSWGADNSVARDANLFDVNVGTLGNGLGIGAGNPVRMSVYFTDVAFGTWDANGLTLAKLSDTSRLLSLRDRANGMTLVTQVIGTQIVFTVTGTGALAAGERATLDLGLLGLVNLPDPSTITVGAGATAVSYTLQDVTAGTVKTFPTFGAFVTAFEAALASPKTVKDFVAAGSFDVGSGTLSATTVTALVQ